MLEKSLTEIKTEIHKLEKQYLLSGRELNGLRDQSNKKIIEYRRLSEKFHLFKKEFIIIEKKYQAAKKNISFLKNKIPLMGDSLNQIDRELQETENNIKSLNKQKHALSENISQIEQSRYQTEKSILEKQSEISQLLLHIDKADTEKKKLVNEISETLSKVSDDKIKSEKDLDEFSIDFAHLAGEREQIRTEFNEKKEKTDQLSQKLSFVEKEHLSLLDTIKFEKEFNDLEKTIDNLTKDSEIEAEKVSELEKESFDENKKLDSLLKQNTENKESFFILEKEVKFYDDLVLKVQDNENKFLESNSLIEEAYSDLNQLFLEI